MSAPREYITDKMVLLLISAGLVGILFAIIIGLFSADGAKDLPNWAENVLVAIATAAALKLGDCLSTLVALSTGRQVGTMATQLSQSAPTDTSPVPKSAADAAERTALAAEEEAARIKGEKP